MNYQELEAKKLAFQNKKNQLKLELKKLSQELQITFNSSRKFDILQEMKKIEQELKQDFQSFSLENKFLEVEKPNIQSFSLENEFSEVEKPNIQTPENDNDCQEDQKDDLNIETAPLINESIKTNLNLENKSRLKFDMEEVKKQAAFLWDLAYNQNEILITENDQPLFKIIPCKKTN